MRGKISLAVWGAVGFVPAVLAHGGGNLLDEAIVELAPGASIAEICADHGTFVIADVESRNLYLLGAPSGMDAQAFEAILEGDPRIVEAEVNDAGEAPEAVAGDTQPFFFYVPPADYDDQYAPGLLDLEAAQSVATGTGVVVAVLDGAIDGTHPVLAGRLLPDGISFLSSASNDVGEDGFGFSDAGPVVLAERMPGHGTYVAGIIALVAPEADLLPVAVLDGAGKGRVFATVQGIYYAVDQGADVINLSLSTRSNNRILRDALEFARAHGAVLVAAAGNWDREHPHPLPASSENVIGVAATDAGDFKSGFSNYGGYISLSAPGSGVVSTMPGNSYASWGGTSASAALVSGAVAIIRANDPGASPDQVEWQLVVAAMDLDDINPEYAGLLGSGRLDVAAALDVGCIDPVLPSRGVRDVLHMLGLTSNGDRGRTGPLRLRGN
ncbi:MAG: S8 family serine peptidase [Planctomycetota bacterium]|jgi:subtilisin family serine protease